MDITLKNRSPYLLIVTLNSGHTLHLAPEQTSAPLDHLEVNGNAKVDKLAAGGQLAVAEATHDAHEHGGAPAAVVEHP